MNAAKSQSPRPCEGFDTIYYGASCGVCSAGVRRWQRLLKRRGFMFQPLQSAGAAELLHLKQAEIPAEMKICTCEGRILGGADAIVHICRRIWWTWPLWVLSRLPGIMPILRKSYRLLARNRQKISETCRLKA